MGYQLRDRWLEWPGDMSMQVSVHDIRAHATEVERARIREWAESRQTMAPVEFEDINGYHRCLDDLLDFLKEKE